ncbi:methylmalonyl-CoA mutase family protein [Polycladidibacter hongkongensis]|uniref:methylmalonyl-CoA mutase family protein n=1 Tax=Polycladidibacter hongkongensis TaxID=1647556 RepID=UPI0008352789|nr:methylmalonyl-CoA mutase family protein [Pseudovibrio hongkongensis]
MATQLNRLVNSFERVSRDDWEVAARKALKGQDINALSSVDMDDLTIHGIYEHTGAYPQIKLRENSAGWAVVCRQDHPDIVRANRQMLDDLEGGANAIELVLPGSARARGVGLQLQRLDDAQRLFANVQFGLISTYLDSAPGGRATLALIAEHAKSDASAKGGFTVFGGSDPAGDLAANGRVKGSMEDLSAMFLDVAHFRQDQGIGGAMLKVDGRLYADAGATCAQELGLSLAAATMYLRLVHNGGGTITRANELVYLCLSTTANQFDSIAKARAVRLLWARLLEALELPEQHLHLFMQNSWRGMSQRDPYVNMLRATSACFAAAVGGADAVSLLPFSAANGLPEEFARRQARNAQLVLLEEAHLARVNDPAAGSDFVEARTIDMAQAAWKMFQTIEAQGGIFVALQSGLVQTMLEDSRAKARGVLRDGRYRMIGSSVFANLEEELPAVDGNRATLQHLEPSQHAVFAPPSNAQGQQMGFFAKELASGARVNDLLQGPVNGSAMECVALQGERLAKPFEALRDSADCIKKVRGARPAVLHVMLGSVAARGPMVGFVQNFYAVGGIEVHPAHPLEAAGEESLQTLCDALRTCGAEAVCLSGTAEAFAQMGSMVAAALQRAGAKLVAVATSGEQNSTESFGWAGSHIYEGCDHLQELHRCFGVFSACGSCDLEAV